jgi:polyisoprenoid-binding protein YceI
LGIAVSSLTAPAQTRRFNSKPGTLKVRLEGSSNIHDWQVEGKIIGGFIEVGQNFPTEPGKEVKPGKVDAKVEAFIPVRSLTSIEKDGKPYSTKMDDIMYEKLRITEFGKIVYSLEELVLKESAKAKDQPYVFEARGTIAVAGVTNKITMPVNITPVGADTLQITGATPLKMSDFKIEPPAPKIALGMIKTGDDVKILFDWTVVEKKK